MAAVSRGCDLSVGSGEIMHLHEVGTEGVAGKSVKLLGWLDRLEPRVCKGVLVLEGISVALDTSLLAGVELTVGDLYHFIGELQQPSGPGIAPLLQGPPSWLHAFDHYALTTTPSVCNALRPASTASACCVRGKGESCNLHCFLYVESKTARLRCALFFESFFGDALPD